MGEGEGLNVNRNGAAVVGGMQQQQQQQQQPAVAVAAPPAAGPVVVANGGGGAVEKVKFTVCVRGHQWSSARHVNETLQEFATAIQRNARRLEFIDEDDSIQRLQLAYGDGSEPEDLDVDATLGDVIICMGDKQLVAIVNSARTSAPDPPPNANGTRPATAPSVGPASPIGVAIAGAHHNKPKSKSDTAAAAAAPNGYNGLDTTPNAIETNTTAGPKFMFPPYKGPASRGTPKAPPNIEPSPTLKIAIPPQADPGATTLPFPDYADRGCVGFHSDYMISSSLPPLGPSRSNGKVVIGGCKQGSHSHGHGHGQGSALGDYCPKATPSPAELANMLVRSSSHPHRVGMQQPGGGFGCHGNVGGPLAGIAGQCGNRSNVASPVSSGGFQSFASALLSRLPMLPNQNTVQCPHGASTNIALLAQFLASQLRAFVPVENTRGAAHPSSADAAHTSPCWENKAADTVSAKDAMNVSSGGGGHVPPPNGSNGHMTMPEKENNYPDVVENGSSPKNDSNVKLSVSGSHEKDESSSSANVNAAGNAPSGDVVDSAHPNGRNELVFLVNRRSKTGVGTHHLKMSDLSTYFHLSVVDAAKKLGVSQTTLKKACRKFGLKRWPGRKVRSLESTIHGLEHTIAVGQGAGLEELTEAYMRNEVQKLQQEMDQLVHGTPAQHSPAVRTADLYKRLYSRGWRSKYHSAGRQDVDLNTGNHENRPSGLGPQSAKKATETVKVANPAVNITAAGVQTNQQQKQKPKDEPVRNLHNQTTDARSKQGSDTVMKDVDIEGLLREPGKEESQAVEAASLAVPVNVPVDNGAVVNCNHNTNGEKGSSEREVIVEEKEITFQERSPKRPKRECRTAAEAAVRQGLRSSTCAIHPTGTIKYMLPKLELEEERYA